jgi:short subunit dehydrogenase-like uncharacterized protein
MPDRTRPYDIILFGATGFTGQLTAEYLLANAPAGTKIALAGRNQSKLERVRSEIAVTVPAAAHIPLLTADVNDAASLRAVAESGRVVVTTVGPYLQFGEPVVAACAAAGTDYLDLTGEPEFVDLMYLRHEAQAKATGARLIHSAGFDSIPYDLGVLWTVGQLPEDVPITASGYMKVGGTFSGGTFHSAIGVMGRLRQSAQVARQRKAKEEPLAPGRRVKGVSGTPHREPLAGGWVIPAPTIDPQHILRSARALDRYGPDFTYSHYVVTGSLTNTALLVGGMGAATALAQVSPTRNLLLKIKEPGEGPTPEQRARAFFQVRVIADAGGRRLVTEVSGGDPGYGETSKMLAESALCLVHDDLPERSGQLTPAVAMGQPLIDRLISAGIRFRVIQ